MTTSWMPLSPRRYNACNNCLHQWTSASLSAIQQLTPIAFRDGYILHRVAGRFSDLRGRGLHPTQLLGYLAHLEGRGSLDIHLGNDQLQGLLRPASSLQRLGIRRQGPYLGDLQLQLRQAGGNRLVLEAVGMVPAPTGLFRKDLLPETLTILAPRRLELQREITRLD